MENLDSFGSAEASLQGRVQFVLEKQSQAFRRQDALLAAIEAEVGRPIPERTPLSPLPHTVVSPRRAAAPTPAGTTLHAFNSDSREIIRLRDELNRERRSVEELRASVVDLQRFKVTSDQLQLKVESLERRLVLRDNEVAEARAAARGAFDQMQQARKLAADAQSQRASLDTELRLQFAAVSTRADGEAEGKVAAEAQLKDVTTQLETTSLQLQEHVTLVQNLQQELMQAHQDTESLTTQLREQQHVEDFHQQERNDLEHRCGVLTRQVADLEAELRKVKTEDLIELRAKAKEAQNSTVQVVSLQSELRTAMAALAAEKTNRLALEEAKTHMVSANTDMQRSLQELMQSQLTLQHVSAELETRTHSLHDAEAQLEALRHQLVTATAAKDSSHGRVLDAMKRAEESSTALEAERARGEAVLESERRTHAAEVAALQERLGAMEASQAKEVTLATSRVDAADMELHRTKAELVSVRRELHKVTTELREVRMVTQVETEALRTEVSSATAAADEAAGLRIKLAGAQGQVRELLLRLQRAEVDARQFGPDARAGHQVRVEELIQQKAFLSERVQVLSRVHKDACDLAAALRCKWSIDVRGVPSFRAAVIAVMAANRLQRLLRVRQAGFPPALGPEPELPTSERGTTALLYRGLRKHELKRRLPPSTSHPVIQTIRTAIVTLLSRLEAAPSQRAYDDVCPVHGTPVRPRRRTATTPAL